MYICKVINNEKTEIMKALTTSELNQILIQKGFKSNQGIILPTNKWEADTFIFEECIGGSSYLGLYKKIGSVMSERIIKYNQMSAKDKKEFVNIIL
jgi:hypothetical protein